MLSLSRKRQVIVLLLVLILVAVAAFHFLSLPLARWALESWQKRSPLPGMRVELVSLNLGSGEVAIHPLEGVETGVRIPFSWKWKLFLPALSILIREQWPTLRWKSMALNQSRVDMTLALTLSGDWSAKGQASVETAVLQGYSVRSLSSGFDLSSRGGVWEGMAKSLEHEVRWQLDVAGIDLASTFPLTGSGKAEVRGRGRKALISFTLPRDAGSDPTITGEADLAFTAAPIKQVESRWNWRVSLPQSGVLKADLTCGKLAAPCAKGTADLGSFTVRRINIAARYDGTRKFPGIEARWDWQGLTVRPAAEVSWSRLVDVSGEGTAGGAIGKEINLTLSLKTGPLPWRAEGRGKIRGPDKGSFTLSLPVRLSPEQTLKDWLPSSEVDLAELEGRMDVGIDAAWDRKGAILHWGIRSDGIDGTANKIPFRVSRIRLSGEGYPLFRSQDVNYVLVEKLGEKFSLEKVRLELAWRGRAAVDVVGFNARLAGGELSIEPFTWEVEKGRATSRALLRNAELGLLASAILGESLKAEGKIDGEIPWVVEPGGWKVEKAEIRNRGAGRIQYSDDRVRGVKEKIEYLDEFNDLLAQGQQMLVLKALHNFHYGILQLSADRSVEKGLGVSIRLKGRNPDLAKGQPFDITLPVTGNVEPLLRETVWKAFLGE